MGSAEAIRFTANSAQLDWRRLPGTVAALSSGVRLGGCIAHS